MPKQESALVRRLRKNLADAKGKLADARGELSDARAELKMERALWPSDPDGTRYLTPDKARQMHARENITAIFASPEKVRGATRMTESQFEFVCGKIDEAVKKMGKKAPLFEEDEKPNRGNRCKLFRRAVTLMTGMRASQEVPQEALAAMFAANRLAVPQVCASSL